MSTTAALLIATMAVIFCIISDYYRRKAIRIRNNWERIAYDYKFKFDFEYAELNAARKKIENLQEKLKEKAIAGTAEK